MTASSAHAGPVAKERKYKLLGLVFVVAPLAVFAALAIGVGIGLEPGWWGHLLQLAIAGTLTALVWMRPRLGGPLLGLAGALLGLLIVMQTGDEGAVANLAGVAIVALPLLVAGAFFTIAGYVPAPETPASR